MLLLCARPGFDFDVGQHVKEHLPTPLYKQQGIGIRPSGSGFEPSAHQLDGLESQVVFLEWD